MLQQAALKKGYATPVDRNLSLPTLVPEKSLEGARSAPTALGPRMDTPRKTRTDKRDKRAARDRSELPIAFPLQQVSRSS